MVRQTRPPGWKRYLFVVGCSVVAVTGALIWLAFTVLQPTPPHTVMMATGPEDSTTSAAGKRYREFLARDGIDLRLLPTAGAVADVALLRDPKSGVSIAILPSGVTNQQESPDLVSLGTLFYEPLWVFYRGQSGNQRGILLGRRIAIGQEGSGAHALSLEFLARAGIIHQQTATLLPLSSQESVEKLVHGEIDAAVLLDAWDSPHVRRLLATDGIQLASIARADAFIALYPFLSKVVLPAGVADLVRNRPPEDVVLLAPKASLVVRNDLHPAIVYLLLDAATELHSEPGMFQKAGQFPAPESIELPLGRHAVQFYKTGPPFLQRHLPFWLAVLVQQLLVLLIPAIGLLYPLLRYAPAVYSWAMRHRVYRLYEELALLEAEISSAGGDQYGKDGLIERLDRLEDRASHFRVPTAFEPLLYTLRSHIGLVRRRLERP
jgi:TRAP-type uncharacterized transport system substrate-binding protein